MENQLEKSERKEFLKEIKRDEVIKERIKKAAFEASLSMSNFKRPPPTDQTPIPRQERRKKPIKNFFGRVRQR